MTIQTISIPPGELSALRLAMRDVQVSTRVSQQYTSRTSDPDDMETQESTLRPWAEREVRAATAICSTPVDMRADPLTGHLKCRCAVADAVQSPRRHTLRGPR